MKWPLHRGALHSSRRPPCWNTSIAGCLALALLVTALAACGRPAPTSASAHTTATASATATATPDTTLKLTWRAATVPKGSVYAVAPGDGDIAYACHVASARQLSIAVTRDRAVHWTHAGDIGLTEDANQCFITIDGHQPRTVVITAIWEPKGASPIITFSTSYVTFDGGATWRGLSGPKPYWVSQLATRGGAIYGFLRVQEGEAQVPELAVSRDQMRTWRTILLKISEFDGSDGNYFWLNPDTGALLARGDSAFWASNDAGAHWAQITVPGMTTQGEDTLVQAPTANQPWRLCAAGDDELNPRDLRPNSLTCSFDGGQTWQNEPAINFTVTNVKGTFSSPTTVFALASDGAVLATASAPTYPATSNHFRLEPGSQQWQTISDPPNADGEMNYYPSPGGGIFWESTTSGYATASYP